MSKFYGPVGFGQATQTETSPGVWEVTATEYNFFGDVQENSYKNQYANNVNADVKVTTRISIVANQYAHDHMFDIKYVVWKNIKWEVVSVAEEFPRLILTLGGRYVSEN